jgi:sigma-B regulation protein RsbU (phosphoserine phosphatase)
MHSVLAELSPIIFDSPILVVEDNEINRLFLKKALNAQGFTKLLMVGSAQEALAVIGSFQPEIVLLDVIMPGGMDGFECCAAIRKQACYQDLPILIQTSISEPELRVKAFEKGATDFISKPIYPEELCARVLVHLEKRHSLKSLRLYKNRVEMELENAKQLQLAILPDASEITNIESRCGLDIASYFQPSSEIGGDFWGIKNLFPHQVALWLVDFSGHGVAAALNAFRLQAHVKEHSSLAARPGEYLSHLNDKLLHLLMRGQFATMFYGIIDTQSNQLLYACASAPNPLILRRATGKVETIDGSGNLLGVSLHAYPTQSIPFAPGDILLLYSDALTETANAAGDFIAEHEIAALLEKHHESSSQTIKDAILDSFKQHANGKLGDDLTITICARSKR